MRLNRLISIIICVSFIFFNLEVLAHSYKQGDISIGHIWAKPTSAGDRSAEIYFPLLNNGKVTDKLIAASASWAEKVLMIQATNNDDKREILSYVVLSPNKPVSFIPHRLFLSAEGLKVSLQEGQMMPIELRFEKAGTVKVDVKIEAKS